MEDELSFETGKDAFGRTRHQTHRQDMGGIGAFDSDCRTLYVGKFGHHPPGELEELLWREFGEWGSPENINVIDRLHIAFVRYRSRLNAEFAKVAMSGQALAGREVLNVRWALDDPNPAVKAEVLEGHKVRLVGAAIQRGILRIPDENESEEAKRLRLSSQPAQPACAIGPATQAEIEAQAEEERVAAENERAARDAERLARILGDIGDGEASN